ncbi:MAG: hypothetical protein IKZ07_03725 [Akkermansia sp.]|nr:hypothetical protein [Akkermansia sp.]
MNDLKQFFAAGDADLRATAGEDAELVRKADGERVALRVVVSVAEVAYTLQRATGPKVTCDREAIISREQAGRAPVVGDMLHAGGEVYEIVRVTGWAYDTSWHCDLAVRKVKKP